MKIDEHYTQREEKANIITHQVGLVLAIIGTAVLFAKFAQNPSNNSFLSNALFCFGLIAVYGTSVLYHQAKKKQDKLTLKLLDHLCIFVLIGGTYMPLMNKYFEKPFSTIFLSIIWVLILIGVLLKLFLHSRYNKFFSALIYSMIGSMVLLILKPVYHNTPHEIFYLIMGGGAFYLIGVLFYIWKRKEFTHAIWHCFVILGSIMHYLAIYKTLSY